MLFVPFILIWAFCCDTEFCWRPTEETGIRFSLRLPALTFAKMVLNIAWEMAGSQVPETLLLKLEASQPKAVDSTDELPKKHIHVVLRDAVQLARDLLVGDTGLRCILCVCCSDT